MSTIRNLTAWVAAARPESEIYTPAMELLTNHYFGGNKNLKLSSATINKINTRMNALIQDVNSSLLTNGLATTSAGISSFDLGIAQLA